MTFFFPFFSHFAYESAIFGRRFVHRSGEEQGNGLAGLVFLDVFRFGDDPTFHMTVLGIGYEGIFHRSALPLTVSDVEKHVIRLAGREIVALESHAIRCRQLCPNLIIVQEHGIISRRRDFICSLETRTVPLLHGVGWQAGESNQFARRRHQRDTSDLKFM